MILLLHALLAAMARASGHVHVHGVFTNANSLRILRSTRPWGSFAAQLLMTQSSSEAARVACNALEFPDAYSILQLREGGDASMFVCRVRSPDSHEIVSVLSTQRHTPLLAVEKAIKWHGSALAQHDPPCRLSISPVVFSFDLDEGIF
tara:strand:- start:62 stop:505 length:444 start_codon:yes stop_codon:yes gene_type:complete